MKIFKCIKRYVEGVKFGFKHINVYRGKCQDDMYDKINGEFKTIKEFEFFIKGVILVTRVIPRQLGLLSAVEMTIKHLLDLAHEYLENADPADLL